MEEHQSKADGSELFEGETHSQFYDRFRPKAPDSVINEIITFLSKDKQVTRNLAVDVGCGTGQVSQQLAPYFTTVLGVDVSSSQVAVAQRRNDKPINVQYKVGPAEELPVEDGGVDLVTAFFALHWFDLPQFFGELRRVLRSGGVLAVYCSWMVGFRSTCSESAADLSLQSAKDKLFETFGPFWHPKVDIARTLYKDVKFPFPEKRREWEESVRHNLNDLLGYLTSFSTYQALLKADPDKANDALQEFKESALLALGATDPRECEINVVSKCILILSRKEDA